MNHKYRFILSVCCFSILFVTSCNAPNIKAVNMLTEKLSLYYGESPDSISKYYVFTDSTLVKTPRVKFYHFYDKRDTSQDEKYWIEGVIAFNNITGNYFIYSSKIKGNVICKGNSTYREKISKIAMNFPIYEDTFKSTPDLNLDVFKQRNIGIALKLASIFNDLPPHIKSKITRKVADSLVKFFLYKEVYDKESGYELLKPADVNKIMDVINESHDRLTSDMSFYKRKYNPTSILNNNKSHLDYLKMVQKEASKDNVFIYLNSCPLLFKDGVIMVILNDGLPPSLSHQNFYSLFSVEPILYTVDIFSENM